MSPLETAVVIITHNYSRFLAEAIESAIAQSPTELVIIDDASTDNPLAVVGFCAQSHPSIRYLRIDARCQHEARRAGFHATTSPVLIFLDGDDRLSSDYLSEAVRAMADPDVSIAYCDLQKFGNTNCRIRYSPCNIETGNYIHSAAAVRRSALELSRVMEFPLPESNERFADWWLWRHALHGGGKAVRTNAILYYRQHGDNIHRRQHRSRDFKYCRDVIPCWDRP